MKLIAGLGNPGKRYQKTRHNIGFLAVEHLSLEHNIPLGTSRFKSDSGRGALYGCNVILAKPQTYMNLSGDAISALADYYNIETGDIFVIHDDMDIEFGHLKIKTQGGSAGHRGIASLIMSLQSENFLRIRVGIGKPATGAEPTDFVLQRFTPEEAASLKGILTNIQDCLRLIFTQGTEAAMNRFHGLNQTTFPEGR